MIDCVRELTPDFEAGPPLADEPSADGEYPPLKNPNPNGEQGRFLCPHCKRWIYNEFGGGDNMPEACDDCWCEETLPLPPQLILPLGEAGDAPP